jgi:hypothetical protein
VYNHIGIFRNVSYIFWETLTNGMKLVVKLGDENVLITLIISHKAVSSRLFSRTLKIEIQGTKH